MCVACRGDSDCDAGEVCDTTSHSCVAGCNMDSDCTEPALPACNERAGVEAQYENYQNVHGFFGNGTAMGAAAVRRACEFMRIKLAES